MAVIVSARLGATLKFDEDRVLNVNEGDILTGIVYKKGTTEKTIDEGRLRVLCARTTANTGGPTDCPPEPYMQKFITPTQLIIDYSEENFAQIERINVSDLIDVAGVKDPNAPPEIVIGGEDSEYATLQDAINALQDSGEPVVLTLAEDVAESVVIKGDVTVNLNGHTIRAADNPANTALQHVFYVDGGNLTIEGDGEILCNTWQSYAIFNAGPGDTLTPDKAPAEGNGMGVVTINGGKFVQESTDKAHMGYLVVNHGAKMIINGGDFSMNYDESSLICNGFQANPTINPQMVINGGTFTGGRHTINNDNNGKLTINDGTFTMGTPRGDGTGAGAQSVLRNEASSTAVVKGGTFKGVIKNSNETPGSLEISGGTFDADVTAYLAAGYKQANGEVTK